MTGRSKANHPPLDFFFILVACDAFYRERQASPPLTWEL